MSFNQPPSLASAITALSRRVGILERRPFPRPRFQDLADAALSKIAHGQVPTYDQASGMYIPGNAGGGGGGAIYASDQQEGGSLASLLSVIEITLTETSQVYRSAGAQWQATSTPCQPRIYLATTLDPSNTYLPVAGPVTTLANAYQAAHVSGIETLPAGVHELVSEWTTAGTDVASASLWSSAIVLGGGTGEHVSDTPWSSG